MDKRVGVFKVGDAAHHESARTIVANWPAIEAVKRAPARPQHTNGHGPARRLKVAGATALKESPDFQEF